MIVCFEIEMEVNDVWMISEIRMLGLEMEANDVWVISEIIMFGLEMEVKFNKIQKKNSFIY